MLNTLDISITTQRCTKLGYALPMKTRYQMTEVLDCPSHKDKIRILSRLKKIKILSVLINSLKSETEDEHSSCSKFSERPTKEELEMSKPVLPETERLLCKIMDEQHEAIKDMLDRNQDVF